MSTLQPGQRLRELLSELRLSQSDLAQRLGVTQPYVSQLVSGRKSASLEQWEEIARVLGVEATEFFERPRGRVTARLAGAEVSGPADVVQRVVQGLMGSPTQDLIDNIPPSPTNVRHTGIYELLGYHERGEALERAGIELSGQEEHALRHYGRSGPAVATLDDAVAVVKQWRSWGGLPWAPADEGPEPGVEDLARSSELRAAWRVSDAELEMLRAFRCQGLVRTARQALGLLGIVAFPVVLLWQVFGQLLDLAGWSGDEVAATRLRARIIVVAAGCIVVGLLILILSLD